MTCTYASDRPILGIETSCDETAAAVVAGGRRVLSSVIASQDQIHSQFGGVVPEIASRKHTELMVSVTQQALEEARVTWSDLGGIAVTSGPGLIGSLLVGVSTAKAYHAATGLPLFGVNHLQAHVAANFADVCEHPLQASDLPAVCLVVSGGHTDLVLLHQPTEYELLGMTRDDAAGEAFDKAARVLQLGYPGGPAVSKAAENGDPTAFAFPRPQVADTLDFSFSGLKTALIRQVQQLSPEAQDRPSAEYLDEQTVTNLAASFQAAVVDTLVRNSMQAVHQTAVHRLAISGGVAANRLLREKLAGECARAGLTFHCPPLELCTDNAVMVAIAGYHLLQTREPDNLDLDVFSAMPR